MPNAATPAHHANHSSSKAKSSANASRDGWLRARIHVELLPFHGYREFGRRRGSGFASLVDDSGDT
jgi:hypothetical protein